MRYTNYIYTGHNTHTCAQFNIKLQRLWSGLDLCIIALTALVHISL